ncbi:hypothetical protein ACHA6J_002434, partial [Klebsiella pneumoniae]
MALTLLATNNAESTLASAISATDTSLIVSAGTGAEFPDAVAGESYFKLTLTDAATGSQVEIVNVTAKAGDIFTIERAQEGTLARAWLANDMVANMMTADTLNVIADFAKQASDSAEEAQGYALSASEFGDNKSTFADTEAGLAATTSGQYFRVPQGTGNVLSFRYYKNNSGVAQEVAEYPGQGSITNTIREFPTLAAAQADADAGNIPVGSNAYYRDSDYKYLAIEVINNSGILSATGRVMISKGYIDDLASRGLISTELDDGLDIVDVEYDPVSMRMSKFTMRDGRVFIPLLQLSENAVTGNNIKNGSVSSEKLSLDVQSILSQELDPDTGFSEINYDPVTRRMSSYTTTDGQVFIPLLQVPENSVGNSQLSTEVQQVIPLDLDPDTGYVSVDYDPVTKRMSSYVTTDGDVFISRLLLGDDIVRFSTLTEDVQNKIIAHPQDVVDARPDATRSTLSEIAVRTNARDGSAWSPLPSHVCKAAFGIN